MAINLDDEPVGPETAKYADEAKQYLEDVHRPRKDKLITRPSLDDPRFSEDSEARRQAKAAGLKGPINLDEIPSFRQGKPINLDELDTNSTVPTPRGPAWLENLKSYVPSMEDVKGAFTPRMTAEEATSPAQLQSAMTFGLAGAATAGLPGFVAGVAGTYAMAEAHARERDKFIKMGQSFEEASRSAAISTTILGGILPIAERGVPPVQGQAFKNVTTAAEDMLTPPAGGTAVDLSTLGKRPGGAGVSETMEAARRHQEELLSAAPEPKPGPMIPEPGLRQAGGRVEVKPDVALNPTGSVVRPDQPTLVTPGKPAPGVTLGKEPALSTTPTGSLVQKQRPETQETQIPFERVPKEVRDVRPPLPSALKPVQPTEGPLEQGFLRTAEERVREQAALRELPSIEETIQSQDLWSRAQDLRFSKLQQERVEAEAVLADSRRKAREQWGLYDSAKVPVTERPASVTIQATEVPPVFMDGLPGKMEVPSGSVRLTADVWRELEMSGPLGKRAAQIARDEIDHTAERYAMKHTHDLEDVMTRWFGSSRIGQNINPLTLPSMTKFWNIKEDQVREMVNYLYTKSGEYGPVLEPHDPRVKGAADEIIELVHRFNEHPGIRQATVYEPGQGRVPVGPNTPFYPHHPVSEGARKGLEGRIFDLAYKQWQKKIPDLTRSDFRRMLNEADDQFRRYAGLESGRVFDATDGGTKQPYDVLKKLGYGTDPLKDYFSYFVGASRRGQQMLAEPELAQLERAMQDAFARDQSKLNWLQGMMDRIRGVESGFADRYFSDFVTKANNAVNLSLLQLAAPAQWNQITYLISRAGFVNTFNGLRSMPGWAQDRIVKESGSLFASYVQAYTPSADIFGQQLQRMLQGTQFTTSEATLRALAAKTGDLYYQRLLKMYSGNYESPKFKALMDEMHFTEQDIQRISKSGVTMEDRLKVAQVFANETQGRTGFQGLPGWAADNSAMMRAILNLKRFMLSNGTEIRRQVVDAWERGVPTSTIAARLLRGAAGATAVGELTNDVVYTLAKWDDAFSEKRVPKWMRQAMGPVVGRIVQDTVTGLGSIQAALALSMFNAHADVAASFFVPVAADVAVDTWTNAWKAFQKGDYDALGRYILRHTIGTTGPMGPKPEPGGEGLPKLTPGR